MALNLEDKKALVAEVSRGCSESAIAWWPPSTAG